MAVKTFTTGEVLTAADTNTYLNNGGLVYVSSGSFSNVATVDITGFTSTYTFYRVVFQVGRFTGSGVSPVTATFRTSSGAATGGYYGAGWRMDYLGATAVVAARNNGTDIQISTNVNNFAQSTTVCDVANFGATGLYPNVTGSYYDEGNTGNVVFGYELANTTNVLDRIRLACAQNMVGKWRLYGYREP